MEIRQLEYFLMVSEVKSFTRAAERLYVSQPAVTNAIRSLEEELGIQLFDRAQKQVTLTTEGQIFYRHIDEIMQGISNTLTEIDALKNLNGGSLTIGITALAGIEPIITILQTFKQQYPDIKIDFKESHSEQLKEDLLNDVIDLAFIYTEQSHTALTYLPLAPQELFACCQRQHPLHRSNTVNLKQLVGESLILLSSNCYYRQQIVHEFEKINTLPKISFELNQIETIKKLIVTNMGISILPESLCSENNAITTIALDPPIYISPTLVYKTNRYPSRAAEAFINSAKKGGMINESN